jgi:urate oxidase|tara:strand:+ start:163 stop:369 length:207 start_codon:yes stop_codon:yes gene_type:complete
MSEKHIISMSSKELDTFMDDEFKQLPESSQRAVATLMLMCSDYVDFIVKIDLWDDFEDYIQLDEVEMH